MNPLGTDWESSSAAFSVLYIAMLTNEMKTPPSAIAVPTFDSAHVQKVTETREKTKTA